MVQQVLIFSKKVFATPSNLPLLGIELITFYIICLKMPSELFGLVRALKQCFIACPVQTTLWSQAGFFNIFVAVQ